MIDLASLAFTGTQLHRPECVLTTADGTLHVSDWRGGVTLMAPSGAQRTVLARGEFKPRPNGIAILGSGDWLLAHLGDSEGGVFRLRSDGELTPFLLEVDGVALPPTNYPHVDHLGRVWITVSTRRQPRDLGYRPDVADGFVVLVDQGGARIVADGLGYTNECLIHPDTGQLFVNETFARRLTRFDVDSHGALSNRTEITRFGHGVYPDGLCFDADGGFWITSIVSNRVIRVHASGEQEVVIEDADSDHLDWVEKAYIAGDMGRPHLDKAAGQRLRNISSLAFGGDDLRTIYLGCLLGDSVATFRAPVAGLPTSHRAFRGNWWY